jgi:phosphatidylglycerophosphatase A
MMIEQKVAESRTKRGKVMKVNGPVDVLAVFIATGFGSGLIPFAPGTFGSLVGLALAYGLISNLKAEILLLQNALLLASLFFTLIGIWAGTRAETVFERKDASQIVIDEVAGQLITFVLIVPYLPLLGGQLHWALIAGFALFRLFDIFKPFPINRLQDLTGGFGVMMDDVLAGVYAATGLSFFLYFLTN